MTVDWVVSLQSVSWLSDAAQKLQALVGGELWQEIVKTLGGSTVYIPLDSNYYDRRNRKVFLFAKEHTVRETARKFCLSNRQVRRILSG